MSNDTTKISDLPTKSDLDLPDPKGLGDLNIPDGDNLQINDNINPGTQGAISGNPIPGSSQIQKSGNSKTKLTGGNSSTKNRIKVDPYKINFGPHDENLDEVREVLKDQVSKLKDLKDHLVDYAADNVMKIGEKNRWKSDFHYVDEKIQDMPNLSKSNSFFMNFALKDSVLGPDVLDKLNTIYKRWT